MNKIIYHKGELGILPPFFVASRIIIKADDIGHPVTNMKLNLILFYVAMKYRKEYGTDLFKEPFETWRWGPCLLSVYSEYRRYTNCYIFSDEDRMVNEQTFADFDYEAAGDIDIIDNICNAIISATMNLDSWELSAIARQTTAYQRHYAPCGFQTIPSEAMAESNWNI